MDKAAAMPNSSQKLTEEEAEFVAEMSHEPPSDTGWCHFDPPFLRRAVTRLIRRGWFEEKGEGRDRQYRWTDAGRALLSPQGSDGSAAARKEVEHG